jgi:hypothetical protein
MADKDPTIGSQSPTSAVIVTSPHYSAIVAFVMLICFLSFVAIIPIWVFVNVPAKEELLDWLQRVFFTAFGAVIGLVTARSA